MKRMPQKEQKYSSPDVHGTGRKAGEGAAIPFTDEECAPWICTYTGLRISLVNPTIDDIAVADIAHHLSCINRFTGALRVPYSVGQHSIYVRDIIAATYPNDYMLQMSALFHDSEEAYVNDPSRPLKPIMGERYSAVCVNMRRTIFAALDIEQSLMTHPDIREADDIALMVERRDLLANHPDWPVQPMSGYPRLEPLEWQAVEKKFLRLYNWLENKLDRDINW